MDLPQPLYRAHFDLMAQSAFKQLVCLLLTLFIDGYHPLQPLVEYARSFIRDDGNDGVYPPLIHNASQILFRLLQSSPVVDKLSTTGIATLDRIPRGTGIFALFERFGDVDSAKPLFGSPPSTARMGIFSKKGSKSLPSLYNQHLPPSYIDIIPYSPS